jgi:hypothetical protein
MSMGRWGDLQRIESWAGEIRVNFIRMAALLAFYGYHLANVYLISPDDASIRGAFHLKVTALVVIWGFAGMLLHFCLSRRWCPPGLKYASTVLDLTLVTLLLEVWGGAASHLSILYFPIIAASALRLSLRLVWVSTLGALLAWVLILGYSKFYIRAPVPARTAQIIFGLGLGATGLVAGQIVRQARRLAQGYPVSVEEK